MFLTDAHVCVTFNFTLLCLRPIHQHVLHECSYTRCSGHVARKTELAQVFGSYGNTINANILEILNSKLTKYSECLTTGLALT